MTLRAAADLHQGTEWTVLDILCRRLHTRPDGAVVSVACAQQESSEMTVDDNWNDKTLASVRRMAGVSYFCHHRSFRRLLFLVSKRCDRALSKRGWQIQFNTYGSLSLPFVRLTAACRFLGRSTKWNIHLWRRKQKYALSVDRVFSFGDNNLKLLPFAHNNHLRNSRTTRDHTRTTSHVVRNKTASVVCDITTARYGITLDGLDFKWSMRSRQIHRKT